MEEPATSTPVLDLEAGITWHTMATQLLRHAVPWMGWCSLPSLADAPDTPVGSLPLVIAVSPCPKWQ